jgi:peptide/nickel transport system substrate-binding protein
VVPDLAKSWTISDDGLLIEFHLRRGLRWSDGQPITADDVVFTYRDVVLSEAVSSVFRDAQRLPDGTFPRCEKIDEFTVAFFLSRAFRPLLQALGFPLLPRHVLAPIVAALPSDGAAAVFDGVWSLDTEPSEIVGSGPWRVAEYRPGDGVTLERNPFYHTYDPAGTQLPYYETVECTFVQNYEVALRRFRSGASDILTIRAEDLPLLQLEAEVLGITVRITDEPGPGTTWFFVNQDIGLAQGTQAEKRALYRSLAFRQALAHSIDKQRIVDEVFGGLAFSLWSPVPMPSPFYAGRDGYGGPITEEHATLFPHDPQQAAALLDGLGVVDQNGDGHRQLPSGAPLTLELMTSDESGRLGSGLVLVEGWQAIGLNATLRVVDFRVLVEALSSGTGDLIYMSLSCSDDPHGSAHLYQSCGSLHAHRYSACGDPDEVDRRVDELLALGAGTFDLDEAFAYYREYQQLVAGRLGFIYTVSPAHQYAYYDQVGNAFKSCLSSSSLGNDGLLVELCFDRRL